MKYTYSVHRIVRPKERSSAWGYSVYETNNEIFNNSIISIRFDDEQTANWLAAAVVRAMEGGLTTAQLRGRPLPDLTWTGDLNDDCTAELLDSLAHVEHMAGPRRGGSWWCALSKRDGTELFNSSELAATIKSGIAARWLAELVLALEAGGVPLS